MGRNWARKRGAVFKVLLVGRGKTAEARTGEKKF